MCSDGISVYVLCSIMLLTGRTSTTSEKETNKRKLKGLTFDNF